MFFTFDFKVKYFLFSIGSLPSVDLRFLIIRAFWCVGIFHHIGTSYPNAFKSLWQFLIGCLLVWFIYILLHLNTYTHNLLVLTYWNNYTLRDVFLSTEYLPVSNYSEHKLIVWCVFFQVQNPKSAKCVTMM